VPAIADTSATTITVTPLPINVNIGPGQAAWSAHPTPKIVPPIQ
jgi:hypothetical protein